MCWDALQTIKAGLAGTATTELLDILEAAFGVAEAEDEVPDIQPTPAEAEEVLPSSTFVPKAADTSGQPSTSGLKHKTKTDISGASKRKSAKPSKSGPVALADATPSTLLLKRKRPISTLGSIPITLASMKVASLLNLLSTNVFMLVVVMRGVKTLMNVMFSLKIKRKCQLTSVSSILEYAWLVIFVQNNGGHPFNGRNI